MVAEKKGFSKREKVMMFILIVIAIFAVMVIYVILPMFNRLEEKMDEYHALQVEKIQVDHLLAQESSIKEARDNAVARHEMESTRFLDDSHASDIGRMLTNLVQKHDLLPINQALKEPVEFIIPRVEENNASANDTVFLITSASMSLQGNYINLKSLLDDVATIDYIRVSSLTFTWGVTVEGSETPPDRMSIDFEVTMLKADDYERKLQEEEEDPWAILEEQQRNPFD